MNNKFEKFETNLYNKRWWYSRCIVRLANECCEKKIGMRGRHGWNSLYFGVMHKTSSVRGLRIYPTHTLFSMHDPQVLLYTYDTPRKMYRYISISFQR